MPQVPPAPDSLTSSDFPVLWPVGTRWADNDMFGHLNNAVYYQLFDTAINAWINTSTGVDPVTMSALGIVAESGCRYFSELHFPQSLMVGLAVTRLGRSSVTYRLGVFRAPTARPSPRRSPADHRTRALGARLRRPDQPQAGADSGHHPFIAVDGPRVAKPEIRPDLRRAPAMLRQCQF